MSGDEFVSIHSPMNMQEIMFIHSILGYTDIRYFIDNENYSFAAGFVIGFANTRIELMVEASKKEKALSLLHCLKHKNREKS